MASGIAQRLDYLLETKNQIYNAIKENDNTITKDTTFRNYPEHIQNAIDNSIISQSTLNNLVKKTMNINTSYEDMIWFYIDDNGVYHNNSPKLYEPHIVTNNKNLVIKVKDFYTYPSTGITYFSATTINNGSSDTEGLNATIYFYNYIGDLIDYTSDSSMKCVINKMNANGGTSYISAGVTETVHSNNDKHALLNAYDYSIEINY